MKAFDRHCNMVLEQVNKILKLNFIPDIGIGILNFKYSYFSGAAGI